MSNGDIKILLIVFIFMPFLPFVRITGFPVESF
jgi:hypothetical protein